MNRHSLEGLHYSCAWPEFGQAALLAPALPALQSGTDQEQTITREVMNVIFQLRLRLAGIKLNRRRSGKDTYCKGELFLRKVCFQTLLKSRKCSLHPVREISYKGPWIAGLCRVILFRKVVVGVLHEEKQEPLENAPNVTRVIFR